MSRFVSVVLTMVVAVWCTSGRAEAAGDAARLLPEKVMLYVEARSPKEILALADDWLAGLAGADANALDGALEEVAQDLGLAPDLMRPELMKMKGLTVAIADVDRKTEEAVVLYIAQMGEARALRDALARQLRTLSAEPVATVRGVPIHSDTKDFACLVDDTIVNATRLDVVKDVVERIKGPNAPSLARVPRFQAATAPVHPASSLVVWVDVQAIHEYLKDQEAENDDLAVLDAALDLATVDSVVGELERREQGGLAKWTVRFSGENRAYAAVRTAIAPHTVTTFFSTDYAVVSAGTLADGRGQWRLIEDLIGRVEGVGGEGGFVAGVRELEEVLKIKVDDELFNVVEYGVGMRVGEAGWEKAPELLCVFRLRDPRRAHELMTKAEDAAKAEHAGLEIGRKDLEGQQVRFLAGEEAEHHYAWAVVAGYLLLGTDAEVVSDAVRTLRRQRKCLFEESGARNALAKLHPVSAKLLLVNPVAFLPSAPRNPHAPPPAMAGASTLEGPRHIEVRVDYTHLRSIVRLWLGLPTAK